MINLIVIPPSKYKCMRCGFQFELDLPVPTTCPKCNNMYVDWENYKEVLKQIRKKFPEYYKNEPENL